MTTTRGRGKTVGPTRAVDRPGGMGMNLLPETVLGVPWAIAHTAARNGWRVRTEITWVRNAGATIETGNANASLDRPERRTETIFLLSRARHYRYANQKFAGDPSGDVWIGRSGPSSETLPADIALRCMQLADIGDSDRVLDPLAGSGTVLTAAANLGAECWGIDPRPASLQEARNRMTEPSQRELEDQRPGTRLLPRQAREHPKVPRLKPNHEQDNQENETRGARQAVAS